jgi:A/G-specific adenine glycosylase
MTRRDASPGAFATRVVAWWQASGRRDLPWQRKPTPYRVWVSEIMLQQTQVATVIPYYQRFMRRFPGLRTLADADVDEVLTHWSGLGYYARARNLHRAARIVRDRHGGRVPRDMERLVALPGIGRSTAGAILSLALDQPHAILDGNVKRVLCRHAGVDGWPGATAVQRRLWAIAQERLPAGDHAAYTQAMMDLGATVCTARAPDCQDCPVQEDCTAHREQRVPTLPAPKPKKPLPRRRAVFLLARDTRGTVLLERRPPAGIWGGLWCPPQIEDDGAELLSGDDHEAITSALAARGLKAAAAGRALAVIEHTFSHFHLQMAPLLVPVLTDPAWVAEGPDQRWVGPSDANHLKALGLAAPVARLVASLAYEQT